MMDWKYWEGKKVFLKLKDGTVYNGTVQEIADAGDNLIFISITDKFGELVTCSVREIIKIVDETEKEENGRAD